MSVSTFLLGAKPHAAEIDLSATLTRKTLEITGTCNETTGQRGLGAKPHTGVARSQTGCAGSEIHGTWHSVTVSDDVSWKVKIGLHQFDNYLSQVKINVTAIIKISGDFFIFQQGSAQLQHTQE